MNTHRATPFALFRALALFTALSLLLGALSGCSRPSQPPGDLGPETEGSATDLDGVTTVDEYAYVPSANLPEVKGASNYTFDETEKIVKFPINVWIGWLPIVAANHGFAPSEDSVFFRDSGFKVELKLIDDPVEARNTYASGESHVLWGTLDMMVLFAPGLMKDSRTAPRICQQIDWSAGGDGIVVRDAIKTVADLKGKTLVYAQNSPSEYYVNRLLLDAGLNPKTDVTAKYTQTAFEAARAFVMDKAIDGCVSWAPDIYSIPEKVKGTRTLSTTAEADTMIADVWAVRADFARDHPQIVTGLVAGIFRGMESLTDEEQRAQAVKWLAAGYNLPEDEIKAMLQDARSTGLSDNEAFFLDDGNEASFEKTWARITQVYKQLGRLKTEVPAEQVKDAGHIQALVDAASAG